MQGEKFVRHSHSVSHSLTNKQRIFVVALLLLGMMLSFLVIRFVDPSRTSSFLAPEHILYSNFDMGSRQV